MGTKELKEHSEALYVTTMWGIYSWLTKLKIENRSAMWKVKQFRNQLQMQL